jgi:hypothetical protein
MLAEAKVRGVRNVNNEFRVVPPHTAKLPRKQPVNICEIYQAIRKE